MLILAHGAGAGQKSPFMVRTARALADRGVGCLTFDFPYMAAGRKVPDRAPALEAAWREVIDEAQRMPALEGRPLFIGGKSMGGRIATQVAAQGLDGIGGIVLLGYPLHPPGRRDARRDAHLPSVQQPVLFVQGSDDAFGTAEEISALIPSMRNAHLHVIEGGDHSFKVRGGAAKQAPVFDDVIRAVCNWIATVSRS